MGLGIRDNNLNIIQIANNTSPDTDSGGSKLKNQQTFSTKAVIWRPFFIHPLQAYRKRKNLKETIFQLVLYVKNHEIFKK